MVGGLVDRALAQFERKKGGVGTCSEAGGVSDCHVAAAGSVGRLAGVIAQHVAAPLGIPSDEV